MHQALSTCLLTDELCGEKALIECPELNSGERAVRRSRPLQIIIIDIIISGMEETQCLKQQGCGLRAWDQPRHAEADAWHGMGMMHERRLVTSSRSEREQDALKPAEGSQGSIHVTVIGLVFLVGKSNAESAYPKVPGRRGVSIRTCWYRGTEVAKMMGRDPS